MGNIEKKDKHSIEKNEVKTLNYLELSNDNKIINNKL